MTGVALALVLAASEPDAGVLAEVYTVCPDASDAGDAFYVDGGPAPGWFLPDPRGARLACKLASCEAYAENPPPVTTVTVVSNIITAVVGIVATIVGVVLKK